MSYEGGGKRGYQVDVLLCLSQHKKRAPKNKEKRDCEIALVRTKESVLEPKCFEPLM